MTPGLLALALAVMAQQEISDVSKLFKAFRNSFEASYPVPKPNEPIKVYATDDINTKMCYISGDSIHIYSNGRDTRPIYAKAFNVKAVNRITYHKSDIGDSFLIWIDDDLVLSISP